MSAEQITQSHNIDGISPIPTAECTSSFTRDDRTEQHWSYADGTYGLHVKRREDDGRIHTYARLGDDTNGWRYIDVTNVMDAAVAEFQTQAALQEQQPEV